MKKVILILIILGLTPALYAEDTSADATGDKVQVENQTSNKGLEKQLKIMEKTLHKKGLDIEARKTAAQEMKRMCENEGYTPHQARNIVSETALECHRLGITGTELANRVREAIQQRKQERSMQKADKGSGDGTCAEIREQQRIQRHYGEERGGSGSGSGDGSGQGGEGNQGGNDDRGGQGTGSGHNKNGK